MQIKSVIAYYANRIAQMVNKPLKLLASFRD